MFKKAIALVLVSMLSTGILAGCGAAKGEETKGTKGTEGETTKDSTQSTTDTADAGGKTKIVFWHAMGGRNGEYLDGMVADFNASQDKIEIEAQYQGTYDDAITKLRSTVEGQGPDIMQLYDVGTRWMIDSKRALKMQDFINSESYDISDYQENILAYYTLNDELYSMPFNGSSPVVVYNKDALTKAGLDPKTAFVDLDTCITTAQELQEKGEVPVGGSLSNYSWVFEQLIGFQGKEFLDNGNGRTDRATKTIIDENGSGLALLKKWKEVAASPNMETYGKMTKDAKAQFANGTLGFLVDSCSIYVDISEAASFEVGFAPLPKVNPEDQGGTSVGGGSLWIMDNGDDARANAAWEFIKYATSPEVQADWAAGTGYLPISKSAAELPAYKDYVANVNPEIMVAIEALEQSKPTDAGSVMGVFPQSRVIIENEVETLINDESRTPEDTLESICSQINSEIEMYNKTN